MTEIGQQNTLEVIKRTDFGLFLDGDELGEILLPNRYVPDGCEVGDSVDVFIYNDSEDRLVATTQRPRARVGQFAYLKVVDVNQVGAFLDWGLPKDLLVPFYEQGRDKKMLVDRSYVVYVYLDEKTDLIVASAKLDKHLQVSSPWLKPGQAVNLLIAGKSDLGYKAIIDNSCWGLVFHGDALQPLKYGQKIKGFIKNIRGDGKIDLSLQKTGEGKIDDLASRILKALEHADGFLTVTDKSDPKVIFETFGASKRAYKMAVGSLLKQKKLSIEKDGIRLSK